VSTAAIHQLTVTLPSNCVCVCVCVCVYIYIYIYIYIFLYCCRYAAFIWAGFINVHCGTVFTVHHHSQKNTKVKVYIYILRKSIFDGCIQMLNEASDATCCVVYTWFYNGETMAWH
uniref:Uncharacterized protein n=1 Tax=Nothoprocta perdicaria TaxID=30464 RepID=A0A8C6Z1C7_NOTPE